MMTDYTNLRKIVTGDIIIKCRLGNEIRRIPINQVPTYDELCLMMYRVFKSEISTPENISLKYMDNEGDMISLLEDIDISHAISISSLLKVTVYDKSLIAKQHNQPSSQLQASLIEIRDNLNNLIESLGKVDINDKESTAKAAAAIAEKEESKQATHRLTPAELAEFLNDTSAPKKTTETEEKASIKELATLSPEASRSSNIPYYPPPQPQTQPQGQPQQQLQQQQQQPIHHQYVPSPSVGIPQQQQQQQQQPQQQQQQRPISVQQQHPQQAPQNNPYPPPPQYGNTPNYPPPPPLTQQASDPRIQQQQQQQQVPRQAYYVPPPPATMNAATPQLPPQPYNPSARW